MPKSKPRKSNTTSAGPKYGANIGKTSSRNNLIAGLAVAAVIIAAGAFFWNAKQGSNAMEAEVIALAETGQVALANVRTVPSQGEQHLAIGQDKNYPEPFPTSGDHAPTTVNPAFYGREIPKINLVHNLEHGNIVIYYDTPGDEVMDTLKDWTKQYPGVWDGVVVAPSPGLGSVVVLTAWTKIMRLESFDMAAAAAFMDAYRGRGPENKVR